MKTQEIKIGTIDEWLETDKEVANEIIESKRDINLEFNDWYEPIIEGFIEDAADKGFEISTEDVQFTGFWSQGDGASFTGSINVIDFLRYHKKLSQFGALRRAIDNGYIDEIISIDRTSNHYSHENTCEVNGFEYYDDDMITKLAEYQMEEVLGWLEEERVDMCKTLYRNLEEYYTELQEDEAVIETLSVNEYEFNEFAEMA